MSLQQKLEFLDSLEIDEQFSLSAQEIITLAYAKVGRVYHFMRKETESQQHPYNKQETGAEATSQNLQLWNKYHNNTILEQSKLLRQLPSGASQNMGASAQQQFPSINPKILRYSDSSNSIIYETQSNMKDTNRQNEFVSLTKIQAGDNSGILSSPLSSQANSSLRKLQFPAKVLQQQNNSNSQMEPSSNFPHSLSDNTFGESQKVSAFLNYLNYQLDNDSRNYHGINKEDTKGIQVEGDTHRKRKVPESLQKFLRDVAEKDLDCGNVMNLNYDKIAKEDNFQFQQIKRELTESLVQIKDFEQILIYSSPKKIKTSMKDCAFRGSLYRGVSKNKKKWQMMVMGKFQKFYVGGIAQEEMAALLYDRYAILLHGLKAKTNFDYNKRDIENILSHALKMTCPPAIETIKGEHEQPVHQ